MNLKLSTFVLFSSILCASPALWAERLRLSEGTPVRLHLKADLSSQHAQEGDRVDLEVARPVMVRGRVAIPQGAVAWGAVQTLKKKEIKFDIQGLRLPDLREVKLRTVREKPRRESRDQIKIETDLGEGVGAARGTEYTAYLAEDIDVQVATEPAPALPAPTPAPAPAKPVPSPAPVVATPALSAPAPQPVAPVTAPPASAPAVTPRPAAPAPQPTTAAHPANPADTAADLVTVECFSTPSGADILVDGDFYGQTPSILKLSAGSHHLEFQVSGYKQFTQDLNLAAGTGIRTIRGTLEKKE
jgi:hypothetical protein